MIYACSSRADPDNVRNSIYIRLKIYISGILAEK